MLTFQTGEHFITWNIKKTCHGSSTFTEATNFRCFKLHLLRMDRNHYFHQSSLCWPQRVRSCEVLTYIVILIVSEQLTRLLIVLHESLWLFWSNRLELKVTITADLRIIILPLLQWVVLQSLPKTYFRMAVNAKVISRGQQILPRFFICSNLNEIINSPPKEEQEIHFLKLLLYLAAHNITNTHISVI